MQNNNAGAERRKYTRQPIQLSALVHPAQGRSWLCSIRDFCEAGMLLMGSSGGRSLTGDGSEMVAGDTVDLHFSVSSQGQTQHHRMRARVARVLQGGQGLGISFAEGLAPDIYAQLMSVAVATGLATTAYPTHDISEVPDHRAPSKPSEPVEAPPVASAAGRGRNESAAKAELLKRVTTITQRAAGQIGTLFCERTSQALLVSARDAGSNEAERQFLEALDALERQQPAFLSAFSAALVGQIEEIPDLEAVLARRRKLDNNAQQGSDLQLVDTTEFEHWLLVVESIARSENKFKDALLDMRAQFGLLAKPWSHKDVLPVGPAAIWWAFDDAQAALDFAPALHKKIFAQFEVVLHGVLARFYEALGKLFADSGIVPALEPLREALQPKMTVRQQPGAALLAEDYQKMDPSVRAAVMAAEHAGGGRTGIAATQPDRATGPAASAFATARNMLDVSRQADPAAQMAALQAGLAAPHTGGSGTFDVADIVEALSNLQSDDGAPANHDQSLRGMLLQQLRRRHGEDKGFAVEDHDRLQVMETLWGALSEDPLITEGVRDWVQRLEITLNKLAAKEPEFLQGDPDNPHYAVRMLNQLARLGASADIRQGIDREVGERVDELLQRVIEEYDSNPQVFADAVDELIPLIDRQARSYRGNLERTIRASEGQQKLARARRAVVNAVAERIGDQQVPALLLELLNPGWRNLLVHTHLRQGAESHDWQHQLTLLDQVQQQMTGALTSADPGFIEPESLLRQIVDGLDSISFDPSKRTPLVMHLSDALVGDTTGAKAPVSLVHVQGDAVEQSLGLAELLPLAEPESDAADELVRENWSRAVARARRIQVGEWLATSDSDGRPLILTVAFVGDDGASFVMVNRKGVKALERSLKEMADDLHAGHIKLLEDYDMPLMERASQRMLENLHHQLAFMASHDELTQLLNRREFERVIEARLAQAKARTLQHALLFFDLDQFKIVNTTSGHRAGDDLLRLVSETLSRQFSQADQTLARLGGDEFGLLLEDVTSTGAREMAYQVLEAVRNIKFEWEARQYNLTASLGLVFLDPSTESTEAAMQRAEEACFTAKDAGRNRVQEYELGDKRMVQRHGAMEWVTQLDAALQDDRLILNCQKIAAVNPELTADQEHYEILLTMLDELGDVVAPTELIHAAETYNRMTTIDRWVIRNVLNWMADHRDILDGFGGFSINVSGHSVNDNAFPDFVLEQFSRTQAPTGKVCFEITETAAIANLDNAIEFMNRMRIIGCRFSLDDFGTGLSSYSYLRNLPVDYVKIDGVFVRDIHRNEADFAVVRSINEIGHYMGKRTVAEYVEDEEILARLREIGVDFAQGYAISKPCLLQDLKV